MCYNEKHRAGRARKSRLEAPRLLSSIREVLWPSSSSTWAGKRGSAESEKSSRDGAKMWQLPSSSSVGVKVLGRSVRLDKESVEN
jgi:hypothetical protein